MNTNDELNNINEVHALICKRIHDCVRKTNITYKQLGREIGKDESYITKVLKGTHPSLDVLVNFCNYLHVTMNDFFDTEIECVSEYSKAKELMKKESKERIEAVCLLLQDKQQ